MARISYDEQAAAAFKTVREVPRDGLSEWRDRRADTTMRDLTEDEFRRGKERLRRAVRHAEDTASPETRNNWLDLLVSLTGY